MDLRSWVRELNRRHVIRVGMAYLVVAWLLVQVSATVAPELGLPAWTTKFVLLGAILGFPAALVLSWLFDLHPAVTADPADEQAPAAAALDPRRIAILPFSNFSSSRDDDYFADGVTEELTSVISRVSGLEVIARTSVMPYKTAPKAVAKIARDLRAGSVLEGSVRRADDRVRVTVQLIDGTSESHIWSQDYDRELRDIFAIQSSIASAVAEALQVRLLPVEQQRIEKVPTRDLAAYDLYLLGRHQLVQRNHETLLRAIALFESALAKDPTYALAAAGLGEAFMWASIGYVINAPHDAAQKARAAAELGVRLDDNLAETHVALGMVANLQYDMETAWRSLQRALELNPSSAAAHQGVAFYWIVRGDFDEQLRCIERAVELDPRSANIRTEAGWPYGYMRRYDTYLERLREALQLDPDYALAHFNVGNCLEAFGDLSGAKAAYERALQLSGGFAFAQAFLVRVEVKRGNVEGARALLDHLSERATREPGVAMPLAVAHDALGEGEKAVAWIERGYADNESAARWLHLEGFLPFEHTRDHPRFQQLLEQDDRALGRHPAGA